MTQLNQNPFLPVALFATTLFYFLKQHKPKKQPQPGKVNGVIKPPFPESISSMLSSCRLAYLSTVDADSSHLSLMRFTYVKDAEDGEVVILSTQRKTKKFEMLQRQKGVALLIHDFDHQGSGGVHSITLNGKCHTIEDEKRSEKYRAAHLQHNPDYPQFIVGDDIAMLCIDVESARICNINDQVTHWHVGDSSH